MIGDQLIMKQVFLSIIPIALKITDHDDRVEKSGAVNITGGMNSRLTDKRRRVAPDDLGAILQTLKQVATPQVTCEEGIGLGLPLANALINLHDGVSTIVKCIEREYHSFSLSSGEAYSRRPIVSFILAQR